MKKSKLAIDPGDSEYWDRPLWVVYGPDCFPTVICCKIIRHPSEGPCIWGYSVYRRQPGFRTLGVRLTDWQAKHEGQFFDSQGLALTFLRSLLTPKEGL